MSAIPQRRVLVVDDEPLVCGTLKMALAFEGYAVEIANGSEEGLGLFRKGRYDENVTDYEMQWMGGDKLALAIKAQAPTQRIVRVAAYAEVLTAAGRTVPGIDFMLGQPFCLEDLRLALETVCGGG